MIRHAQESADGFLEWRKNICSFANVFDGNENVVIYGAGRIGQWFRNSVLKSYEPSRIIYCDKQFSKKGEIEGVAIISPEDFKTHYKSQRIVIASTIFFDEICRELMTEEISQANVYSIGMGETELKQIGRVSNRSTEHRCSTKNNCNTCDFPAQIQTTKDNYDEKCYLYANSDVLCAVSMKLFRTGYEHFLLYGSREKRKQLSDSTKADKNVVLKNSASDRNKVILSDCNLNGKGLEIGASFNPIAPKALGFDIDVMDHLDREGLISKYSNDKNMPSDFEDRIEEVDYVWMGEKYKELIGKTDYYDYILSSHLIEHVPSLIDHLNSCSELLKQGGVYSLAIPDKRYTFDFFRPVSTVKDCINNAQFSPYKHSKGSVAEHHMFCVRDNETKGTAIDCRNAENIYETFQFDKIELFVNNENVYVDIHEYVFVPASFELLISELNQLGYIDVEVDSLHVFDGAAEFYVTLKKTGRNVELQNEKRMYLMKKMMYEQYEQFIQTKTTQCMGERVIL